MNKYVVMSSLLLVSGVARAMELIEKQDKEKSYKTLKEATWPSVDEERYLHTLNLQGQFITTLGGFARYMPEAINKYAIISLNVSCNYLQDLDMQTIMSCLTSLENCNASHNQLTEVPAFSQYMRRLKWLNLSNNQIKEYCIDDYTPKEELDLSDNPLDSLTCAECIYWKEGDTPVLRLHNTSLTNDQIQEVRDRYAQVVSEKRAQSNLFAASLLTGLFSAPAIGFCTSISAHMQIEASPVASTFIILGGSLFGGVLNSAMTYGVLRLMCCEQAIEQERLEAEQKASSNIITDDGQDNDDEQIVLDLLGL